MLALNSRLAAVEQDSGEYRPRHFRLPGDKAALQALLEQQPGLRITDRIQAQVRELVKSLHPGTRFTEEALREAAARHLAGRAPEEYGCWVYYPWGNRLVHLLDADEFGLVRTDRNRQKITREEQAVLARKKVGVIGLSVGQSVSLTMALERTFGEIRLADFDSLDLSNLNRIRAGAHNLGLNKAIITAREIAEIDPYLHVVCFTDGLTQGNMDAFFTEGGKLDVLIEVCDGVDMKILARQKAKALGIPVVMDTSDRGCIDIERFDLEPDRPILHGRIDHLDLDAAGRPMTAEEKLSFVLPITGVETLSPRMKASVIELGQTISTWPQLASSVVLGGALAGDAVRRIALDQFHTSGRWHVDLEELVADSPDRTALTKSGIESRRPNSADWSAPASLSGAASADALDLDRNTILKLVEAGGMAPSAGNTQPWRFAWHEKQLHLFLHPERSRSVWDPAHQSAEIALGAAMENVVLRAHELGVEVEIRASRHGNNGPLASFEFNGSPTQNSEPHDFDHLATQMAERRTTRDISGGPGAISEQAIAAFIRVLEKGAFCKGHLLPAPDDLDSLASLYAQAERICLLDPEGHEEFFRETLRWSRSQAEARLTGFELSAYALPAMVEASMQALSDSRTADLLRSWGGGRNIGIPQAMAIRSSSAALLITVPADGPGTWLAAGRAIQRAWLHATATGIGIQPLGSIGRVLSLGKHNPARVSPNDQQTLAAIEQGLHTLFHAPSGVPALLLRLAAPSPLTRRTLRFSPETILQSYTQVES